MPTEQRKVIVVEREKLGAFTRKWDFGAFPPEISAPAVQDGSPASIKAMNEYWKKEKDQEHDWEVVKPTNRLNAFKKEFPELPDVIRNLHRSWPEIPLGNACRPEGKMSREDMWACDGYLEKALGKYPMQP